MTVKELTIEMKHTLPLDFFIRPATMDDVEMVVDLRNTFSHAYIGADEAPVEVVLNEWGTPGFNLETDARLVFSSDDKLVGYIEVWTTTNPPVHPWVWGCTHPDYEGLNIGTYLQTWAEERTRQVFPRVPEEARVSLRTGSYNSVEPAKRLFESLGRRLTRHMFRMLIEMDTPPPEPQWPPGLRSGAPITIRAANPEEDIEAIFRVDDEAFKDHFGYVEEPYEDGLKRFSHHFLNQEDLDPNLWFLAMEGEEMVAICLCRQRSYEVKDTGYISSLAVLRPWRKRGIGLALLHLAFGEFYRRGKRKVALGVDAENLTGALNLYKRAGMHVHRQFDIYEKELRPGVELSRTFLEE